jgi:hypothetical protein
VRNTAGCPCYRAWLPGRFVHLGGNVEVAVLVFDLEGAPKECVVIFRKEVMVVSEKFDDILFHVDDGLLRIVGFYSFIGSHVGYMVQGGLDVLGAFDDAGSKIFVGRQYGEVFRVLLAFK